MRRLLRLQLGLLLCLPTLILADGDRIVREDVNSLRIELPEDKVIFEVSLTQLEREKLTEKQEGDEYFAFYEGKKVPVETLFLRPSLIQSFTLSIDGKNIPIPERFWNDISGFYLTKYDLVVPNPTEQDKWDLEERLASVRMRPQVSRSENGSTVLITWARPEE